MSNINETGKIYERPWGTYQTLSFTKKSQTKIITVIPTGQLSLQKHFKRAEHWVVVNGVATVTVGEKVFNLNKNESCYIPNRTRHRLQNLSEMSLEIVEVQSGSYFGEDDIVRFDDNYGR